MNTQTLVFLSRLAPGFEGNPLNDRLYEVVTANDGERIASTTNQDEAWTLAKDLNVVINQWAERIGSDAVIGG